MDALQNLETVPITRSVGFIGSFLCKCLLNNSDVKVVGYDNLNNYYDDGIKNNRLFT